MDEIQQSELFYFMEQKMETKKENYKTKDLYQAAFLYAHQQKLLTLEKDGKYYWFIFKDKFTCEDLSTAYWAGDIEINAKAYSDAIRTLKDRLFAMKEG